MRRLFIVFHLLILSACCFSQEALQPRPSPIGIVTARYKDTYLKITFGQPHKRGREVFGKMVPFDQVWRTGANEATELTITKDVTISGKLVKEGTYSLFSIPGREKWIIIINSDVGLWGSYNYNVKKDVIRFEVPVSMNNTTVYEVFTILIEQKNEKANISLAWDQTSISFPIQFNEPN
jgi:hypothetical protein